MGMLSTAMQQQHRSDLGSLFNSLALDTMSYYMRVLSRRMALYRASISLLLTHKQRPSTNEMWRSLPDRCVGRLMVNGVVVQAWAPKPDPTGQQLPTSKRAP